MTATQFELRQSKRRNDARRAAWRAAAVHRVGIEVGTAPSGPRKGMPVYFTKCSCGWRGGGCENAPDAHAMNVEHAERMQAERAKR